MKYKMIVLDLDDTLLRDDLTISPRTKEALMAAQKEGVKVVLASGRPTFGMKPIAKELELEKFGSYILSFNGAKITDCRTEEEIFSSTLSVETVQRLYRISQEEGLSILTYGKDHIITEQSNEYVKIESGLTGMRIQETASFVETVQELGRQNVDGRRSRQGGGSGDKIAAAIGKRTQRHALEAVFPGIHRSGRR